MKNDYVKKDVSLINKPSMWDMVEEEVYKVKSILGGHQVRDGLVIFLCIIVCILIFVCTFYITCNYLYLHRKGSSVWSEKIIRCILPLKILSNVLKFDSNLGTKETTPGKDTFELPNSPFVGPEPQR